MRIGFDAKRYFNNKTGLGNFSRQVVHALAEHYPDDEFVLFHENAEKPLANLPNLRVFSPENARWFWRSRGIARDAAAQGIDVFHGLSNELPLGLRKAGIRSVVTIHDVIFKRFPGFYPVIDRWIYQKKTQHALANADVVAATSMATAEDLNKFYYYSESQVIYQPVQQEFYQRDQSHIGNEPKYFIYVSSFSSRKNHATLVEAFELVRNLCDWNLVLVGANGNTLDDVKRFVAHEKLGQRIKIITDADSKTLITLMQRASAFVYPSIFEGFGIPLAEAAVCGLPMAVSDIAVFRELAGDAAFYFHPNKAREIADAMIRLTSEEHSATLISHRAAILKKIDAISIAENYMQLYRA